MLKSELMELVARNLGDLAAKDRPIAATSFTVDAYTLIHPLSGQLKGYNFFIYDGAGVGQSRVITDFLPANNRVVVEESFITVPSNNSAFFIFQRFTGDDYLKAFDSAYHRFYNLRNTLLDSWQQRANQLWQLQYLWGWQRKEEQDNWRAVKGQEQAAWAAQQNNWRVHLDESWLEARLRFSSLRRQPFFVFPTLSMAVPGSLSIGVMVVGSLAVPSLSLAAAPSISDISSLGARVSDDAELAFIYTETLAARRITEDTEWKDKVALYGSHLDKVVAGNEVLINRLIDGFKDDWVKHKEQFQQAWSDFTGIYEANWTRFREDYERYKLVVESEYKGLLETYATVLKDRAG